MAEDTMFVTSSFLENRYDSSNYLDKDKSLAIKNELQATLTEEKITNNRLLMNICFHFVIFILTTIMIWIKLDLFYTREAFEGHWNYIYFSILDFSYYNVQTRELHTFPYPCAVIQQTGDLRKCLLQDYCKIGLDIPNIFEFFKVEICNEFSALNFFGIFVN